MPEQGQAALGHPKARGNKAKKKEPKNSLGSYTQTTASKARAQMGLLTPQAGQGGSGQRAEALLSGIQEAEPPGERGISEQNG